MHEHEHRERERERVHLNEMKIGGTTQKNKSKFSNLSKQYSNLHHGTLIDVQEKKKEREKFHLQFVSLLPSSIASQLTWNDVLMLYPKALVTAAAMVVLTTITRITDASNISTWFHRKCTCMSIPILERKRAANRFLIGSTYKVQSHSKHINLIIL